MQAVLPYTVVFRTSIGDTVLVGSETPLRIDAVGAAACLREPRVARDLHRIGVDRPEDLSARLVLDVEDVPRVTRGARLNTDDNGYLEFEAPRTLYQETTRENEALLTQAGGGSGSVHAQIAVLVGVGHPLATGAGPP